MSEVDGTATRSESRPGSGKAGWLDRPWRRIRQGDLGSLPVILSLILIAGVFQSLNGNFLSPRNLTNLTQQVVDYGVISVGIVLVLLLGEIDLSVGSVSGVCSALLAVLLVFNHLPDGVALLGAVVLGGLIGLFQGSWFSLFRLPSFVVTLAGLIAWQGAQLLLLGSAGSVNIPSDGAVAGLILTFLPVEAGWVLAGVIMAVFAATAILTRVRRAAAGLDVAPLTGLVAKVVLVGAGVFVATAILNSDRGVPLSFLILLGLVVGFQYVVRRTRFGRYILAVGGNAEAARRSGISINQIRIAVFGLSGALAAGGGIMAAARTFSVNLSSGSGDVLLNAIAAAVIGGTSLFGGRGTVWSALTGALVIGSINNGILLLSLPASARFIITGAVLLIAVTVDAVARQGRQAAGRA